MFIALRDHNVNAIRTSGAQRIVTADPHAYNALKRDYQDKDIPPVDHISQVIARAVKAGKVKFQPVKLRQRVQLSRSLLFKDVTTRFTTSPERCWTRFLACGEWK